MNKQHYEQRLNDIIAQRPPDPSCDRCDGKGWIGFKPDPSALLIWLKLGKKPCMCCYIQDKEIREAIVSRTKGDIDA